MNSRPEPNRGAIRVLVRFPQGSNDDSLRVNYLVRCEIERQYTELQSRSRVRGRLSWPVGPAKTGGQSTRCVAVAAQSVPVSHCMSRPFHQLLTGNSSSDSATNTGCRNCRISVPLRSVRPCLLFSLFDKSVTANAQRQPTDHNSKVSVGEQQSGPAKKGAMTDW